MFILENVPLTAYSTMRLGGNAAYLTEINNRSEISEALNWAANRNLPVIMIGSGSNIVWRDEGYPGLVMVNKIMRFETYQEDSENLYITVGAGEDWDSVVARTVSMGYSGIEELSLIPGTAGATPVQNVGAYGREISDVLVAVEAYDTVAQQLVNVPNPDCNFSYRSSRFKTTDKHRFYISAIMLHVTKTLPQPPFYESLQRYLKANDITSYTPQTIRDAVIAIRTSKLPDPSRVANNGSFFQNPIIERQQLINLLQQYPKMVYWELDDGRAKLSAAWLLDSAGFKDYHDSETGMATWPTQPLVFINERATTTAQLLRFKQKIIEVIQSKFGITLQQEPEILPNIP